MNNKGCIVNIIRFILRLFGYQSTPKTVFQDTQYRKVLDHWVAELLSVWLHESDERIDQKRAYAVLTGNGADYATTIDMVKNALLDANITFAQHGSQYTVQVQAYINEAVVNGATPTALRKRAQRGVQWHEIPDEIRAKMITQREPVTLSYSVPG